MYSKVGAKDADLLVIGKKRISRKRKLFICVLFVATVLTGMSVLEKMNAPAPTPVDTSVKIVATMPKPASGSPADYSAYENFCIAAGVLNSASYFRADTEGTIVASVFGAPYNQTLEGHRVSKDGRLFHEVNSTSTMKSVGEQRFFAQDTILMRTAKYKKGVPTWGSIGLVQTDDFSAKYGIIPREICLYVVNEDTVLESGFVKEENGLKTYYMVLDPAAAPERYKRQVGALGGASDYPVFESIKLTYTIDSDWVIQSHTVEETYDISIAGLGAMTCRAVMTETFSDIGASLDFPDAAQDFLTLAPGSVGDLDDKPVMGASDYLAEAFGGYLGGDAIKFSANIDALGLKLPLKGFIDIKNLDIRVAIGDILYAAYKDNIIYAKSGDGKIKIPVSSLTPVIEELKPILNDAGVDLGQISSLLEGDLIGTLFGNSDIEENGNDVHILMPFGLMNIGFDIDMHLKKAGEKFYPHAIVATLDLKELGLDKLIKTDDGQYKVKVNLNFTSEELPAPDDGYAEFDPSFVKDFISPVKNAISASAYDLGGSVTVNGTKIELENMQIVRGETLTAKAQIKVMGITADIKFVDNTVYISAGNIKLKAAVSDLPALVNEILALIPNGDKIVPAVKDALGSLENISVPSVLESALKFLPTLEYKNGSLGIEIKGVKASVTPSKDGISVVLPKFTVKDTAVSADFYFKSIAEQTAPVSVDNADSYVSAADLMPYLAPVKSIMNSKSLQATVNGNVSGLDQKDPTEQITLSGGMTLNLHDGENRALSMKAEFEALSQNLSLALSGNKAYIALNDGIKLSLDIGKDSLSGIMAAVNAALPQDKKLADAKITSALSIVDNILSLDLKSLFSHIQINESTLTKVMGSIRALEYKDNALILTISVNDITVTVSLEKPENGDALTANVNVNFAPKAQDGEEPKSPVNAQITLTLNNFSENVADISVKDPESYVSSETLCSLISPAVNAVFANAYDLGGSVTVNKTKIELENARIVRGESITLKAQIKVMGITADIKFVDNVIYISAGNIKLKAAISDFGALANAITPLIPNSDELLGKVNGLIEKFKNTDPLEAIKKIEISETQDGGLRISYDDITAKIKAVSDNGLSLDVPTLSFKIGETTDENGEKVDKLFKISANASLTAVREQAAPVTVDDANKYVSATDIVPYIAPVMKLISSESLKATLENGSVDSNDIKKYLQATDLSGDLALNIGKDGGLSLQAALSAFGHKLDLTFLNSTAYVSVNDLINLSLNTNNLSDILGNINKTLPDEKKIDVEKITSTIGKIEKLDLSSLIKFDESTLTKVLGYVRALEYKDGSLILTLSFGDITVTASIVSPADGANSLTVNLRVNYAPAAKPNEKAKDPINVNIDVTLFDFSDERIEINVVDPEKYVASKTIADFIKPVIETLNQDKFHITFSASIDGKDANGAAANTTISGELKIVASTKITNASFPEMYLLLNIGDKANPKQHVLQLLVEKDAASKIQLYANYNGMKIHLGYDAALQIVGAVCDILRIDIPMIKNLTAGHYDPEADKIDTDIFGDATIAGLTEKIEDLNGLFAVVDGGKSAFEELMNKVLYGALDEALRSISLSMDDGGLKISVKNTLLERIMEIVNGDGKNGETAETPTTPAPKNDLGNAVVSVSHGVNENNGSDILSALHISNLAVNGKTVTFDADLVNTEKLPEKTDGTEIPDETVKITLPKSTNAEFSSAMDFDSLYDFLVSVINTANTRYFPISGTIPLKVLADNTVVNFALNVAIVDNPKYDPNAVAPENDPNYKPEPKTKVVVGLKVAHSLKATSDFEGIFQAAKWFLEPTISYLYFDGDNIYVQRDIYESVRIPWTLSYEWKFKNTVKKYSFPASEFGQKALDVIFDVIPIKESLKNDITSSSSNTQGSERTINYGNLLKEYKKDGSTYSLALNLDELAGTNNILGNLTANIYTKNINDGSTDKSYISGFNAEVHVNILNAITATINADLASIQKNDTNPSSLPTIEFGYDANKNMQDPFELTFEKYIDKDTHKERYRVTNYEAFVEKLKSIF